MKFHDRRRFTMRRQVFGVLVDGSKKRHTGVAQPLGPHFHPATLLCNYIAALATKRVYSQITRESIRVPFARIVALVFLSATRVCFVFRSALASAHLLAPHVHRGKTRDDICSALRIPITKAAHPTKIY